MIFGGAYRTLRREGTMVVGGDILVLVVYEGRGKKISKVGGGFVV